MIIVAVILSFVAGFVDAVAGGGGVINVPVLLFLGMPVDEVLGTSKLVSTSGTVLASSKFIKDGKFSPFVLRVATIFTLVGAFLGALCVSLINPELLKPLVSFLIIGIAIYFFLKPQFGNHFDESILDGRKKIIISMSAFVLGFYDGIFGPGTGAFLTFVFVRCIHQNFLLATGNTKILNLTSNVVALSVFIVAGKVVWAVGIPMAIANMLGGYCGAHFAIKKGSSIVRWIFIIMAILVGLKQIL